MEKAYKVNRNSGEAYVNETGQMEYRKWGLAQEDEQLRGQRDVHRRCGVEGGSIRDAEMLGKL